MEVYEGSGRGTVERKGGKGASGKTVEGSILHRWIVLFPEDLRY